MQKQILAVTLFAAVLSGCSSNSGQGFPTVPDSDVARYILDSNKIEQCLYPKIAQMDSQDKLDEFYQTLPLKEAAFLHHSSEEVLKKIVGDQMFRNIESNSRAKQHFEKQFLRLNHSKPIEVDLAECNAVKKEQKRFLSQYRKKKSK